MTPASHLFICILSLLFFSTSHAAQVYRCIQPDGSISFQQQACSHDGTRIETGEAQAVWSSMRPGEKSLYEQYRKRDKVRQKRKQQLARSKADSGTADAKSCWKKRQQLEAVSAKLRGGYKASKGNDLRRRRASYEDYLRSFCP